MEKIIAADTKDLLRLATFLDASQFKKAYVSYLNELAFQSRKEAVENTVPGNFNFKNSSTKKFITRGIVYEKAKTGNLQSAVGAVGNTSSNDRKEARLYFMETQEKGGKAEQFKSSNVGKRRVLLRQNPSALPGKKSRRVGSSLLTLKPGATPQKFWRGVAVARRVGLRYIASEKGIYQIYKSGMKKLYSFNVNQPTYRIPKRAWLMPAVNAVLSKKNKIWNEVINRIIMKQVQRHKP